MYRMNCSGLLLGCTKPVANSTTWITLAAMVMPWVVPAGA